MGKWAILLFLAAGIAPAAPKGKRVTIQQFEDALRGMHGMSDRKAARELSEIELTERASSTRLSHWEADFRGRRTREALLELADESVFLALPAAEIPAAAPPDPKTQGRILVMSFDFVKSTTARLPDFYATRVTTHFEDTPPHEELEEGQGPSVGNGRRPFSGSMASPAVRQIDYAPLHITGISNAMVTYRDGEEVVDAAKEGEKRDKGKAIGLTTSGEFGPILNVVLYDAAQSKMTWGHWENGPTGLLAVFAYSVPAKNSHYRVTFPNALVTDQIVPDYHGEIAIDPQNGDILRVTVVADMKAPHEGVETAIMVEYAPVSIGGTTYICPVKGVALSKMPVETPSGNEVRPPVMQTRLNDIEFMQYHLFRAELRILPDSGANPPAASAPPAPSPH